LLEWERNTTLVRREGSTLGPSRDIGKCPSEQRPVSARDAVRTNGRSCNGGGEPKKKKLKCEWITDK